MIGKQLQKERLKRKLSQEQLAHRAGLYRTYIGHIEVGRDTPSIYTLYKISYALKTKIKDIISL